MLRIQRSAMPMAAFLLPNALLSLGMKTNRSRRRFAALMLLSAGLAVTAGFEMSARAGIGGGIGRNAVGGVMIEATGAVRTASEAERREFAAVLRDRVAPIQGELTEASEMRVISLRGLEAEVANSIQENRPVADELIYLAGLQQIDYVTVDRENHDICIAGPAEPWTVRDDGSVVGAKSGHSPMRLVDLMVALQSVETARNGGISCSIEPTPEGRRNLQLMLKKVKLQPGQNPKMFEPKMRQAFGPQIVHLTGVENDTRLARTMVAADFEMKRIAMGLAPSPVKGFSSYLEMSRNVRQGNSQNPRWWMACDYETLAHDDQKSVFKISGDRVKTLTDLDMIADDGTASASGKADKVATAWAEKMTENFDALATAIPVFADLENIMDATVVATLIVQEDLANQAGIELTSLINPSGNYDPVDYPAPESIDPQCSFIRGRAGWVVTASGGVDINGFGVVQNQSVDNTLVSKFAELAKAEDAKSWWWNAR